MEQVGARDGAVLASPAWLMVGATQSLPGVLWHDGHRLVLELEGEHAARGFDVPVGEVRDVVFPWYYFGGGCKLTAGGRAVRLSFTRPNGAAAAASNREAMRSVAAIAPGRSAGKAWRQRLVG